MRSTPSRYEEDEEGVTLRFAGGEEVRVPLLVGCDGIWSAVRKQRCRRLGSNSRDAPMQRRLVSSPLRRSLAVALAAGWAPPTRRRATWAWWSY